MITGSDNIGIDNIRGSDNIGSDNIRVVTISILMDFYSVCFLD